VAAPQAPPALGAAAQQPGALSAFVGRQAVAFEEDLAAFIRESAPKVADPELREALLRLEAQHLAHAAALRGIGREADATRRAELDRDLGRGAPERLLAGLQEAGAGLPLGDAAGRIIRRQEAAAQFYIALAQLVRFHEARDVLRALAMEEIRLAQETCALVNHERPPSAVA
jgi:hypothetical protein